VYDSLAFGFGMLQAPKRTTRAFYGGCGCQTVYALGTATVLRTDIQQLREHTKIDEPHTRTWRDHAAYTRGIAMAVVMPFVAMPLMAVVMLQRPTAAAVE
jgi:hypothetical protein